MVPLFEINTQHEALEAELKATFERVLRSGQYINGPEVEAFEAEMAEFVGAKYAVGVSSGTDALLVALMALGIGPGDEVLCPTFTFFATAGAVARLGAKPVFVDLCPICYNLDPDDLARKVTAQSKAIIPVHLFGQAAEMDPIMKIARDSGIAVIEDVAQSMGAQYRGQQVGAIGDFGTFSFFPTKNLGGMGDGGLVTVQDSAMAEKLKQLRNHGMYPQYYHHLVGGNFRLDALQAALLRVKLPYVQQYITARQSNAHYYQKELSQLDGVVLGAAADCPAESDFPDAMIVVPQAYDHSEHTWNQFTVRVRGAGRRDALKAFLQEKSVGAAIYYPVCLHEQQCFSAAVGESEQFPHAELLSQECLSLPVYPELKVEQRKQVVSCIREFMTKQ